MTAAASMERTQQIHPRPEPESLTVALPVSAHKAYALFCDIERTPEWLPIVRMAHVLRRDGKGFAREVAFLAQLQRATVGYSLLYRYDPTRNFVDWHTPSQSSLQVNGFALFEATSPKTCLLTYGLDLELPGLQQLDPMFQGHAVSSTLSDFRDFLIRTLGR